MRCGHAIERFGSALFWSALSATNSTTSARDDRNSHCASMKVCLAVLLAWISASTPLLRTPTLKLMAELKRMPEKFKRLSARLKRLSRHKRINIELSIERSEGGVCLPLWVVPRQNFIGAENGPT